jgi:photosystem II stability/assembly factor-like uncharacterized protein
LARTGDGGKTWHVVQKGQRLVSLRFLTTRRGFALSDRGRLLVTKDGGRSWAVLRAAAWTFAFANARNGWLAGANGLYRTTDGARTWRRLRSPCPRLAEYVGGLSFVDAHRGFVVCGGQPATIMQAKYVYASTDGGTTWRLRTCVHFVQSSRCPGRIEADGHASGLDFRDLREGLLVTARGGIARSEDGGRRWKNTLFTDDEDTVMSTSWASATTVYALLYHRAKLLRSDDAGRHWERV